MWLAAHRSRAAFTAGVGIEYESFIRAELGAGTVERFGRTLVDRGLDPDDFLLIPVHPWQWWNKLAVTFAAEVARGHLVCLGEGDDEYLAQQSIRTFFNKSHPEKHYVKTALSVINMGFMRGLSAAYMEATPAINDWLAQLIDNDPVLKSTGLSIIREQPPSATVTWSTRPRPTATRRTARCSPRCGARARSPRSRRASPWRRWPRWCTWTTRARPSRAR